MSEDVTRRCDNKKRVGRRKVTCDNPLPADRQTLFSLDGEAYSADLCDGCKLLLAEALAPFIQIATPEYKNVEGVVRKVLARLPDGRAVTLVDIRRWAQENGIAVSTTGRVKDTVYTQYREAHGI